MIITNIVGGLGNQMFEYARLRSAQLSDHEQDILLSIFEMDNKSGVTRRIFTLSMFNIAAEVVSDKLNIYLSFRQQIVIFLMKVVSRVRGKASNYFVGGKNYFYSGYWQSEKYFSSIRSQLLADFSLKDSSCLPADLVQQMGNSNSVSLHVRRGDYVTDQKTNQYHGTCDLAYYQRAIKYISEKIEKPILFIFSDDVDWVKENLRTDLETVSVSNGKLKDYQELTMMGKCQHNIIANSSFSWWGAWLNQNINKIVIAPAKWFNHPGASEQDIVPEKWIRL